MNSGQESQLSMYFATSDFLTTNTAIVTPLPNYADFSTILNGYSPQVETIAISDGERTEINILLTSN